MFEWHNNWLDTGDYTKNGGKKVWKNVLFRRLKREWRKKQKMSKETLDIEWIDIDEGFHFNESAKGTDTPIHKIHNKCFVQSLIRYSSKSSELEGGPFIVELNESEIGKISKEHFCILSSNYFLFSSKRWRIEYAEQVRREVKVVSKIGRLKKCLINH